jgi:hypothetical protein
LAGVVRELKSQPEINRFPGRADTGRNNRFRQAIGVLVRIVMEKRGWQKTGHKGSLGVRATPTSKAAAHNQGGLSLWFVRAERYELRTGMPDQSVRQQSEKLESEKSNQKTCTCQGVKSARSLR